jgi:hypothetical protein
VKIREENDVPPDQLEFAIVWFGHFGGGVESGNFVIGFVKHASGERNVWCHNRQTGIKSSC